MMSLLQTRKACFELNASQSVVAYSRTAPCSPQAGTMDETEHESHDKNLRRKRILEDKACEVCGDQSTGKHYGVYSCDGCSGFYKRTCRRSEPWLCKDQGHCLVDKSSRNDCKACRLKKCVDIGMNLEGVYRRSKLRNDEEEPSIADSPTDTSPRDLLVDASSSAEAQGYPLVVPQIRLGQTNPVTVKSEEEDKQPEVQQRVPSPKYHSVNTDEAVARLNSTPATRDQYSQVCQAPHTTPLTTISGSHVSDSVRAHMPVQNSVTSARTFASSTPLTSPRFYPPTTFSPPQQNGHRTPPRTEPVLNRQRRAATALVPVRNVPRHVRPPAQISMSELHQAVDSLSFHTSEPFHDAATRLLSISLRFGRRLPCFRRLPFRDQVILLEEGWKEMLLLDAVFWTFPLNSGSPPGEENSQRRAQELKSLQESLEPLRTLKLDSSEYACLKAVVLFRTNTHGLKSADQVEQLQDEAQLMLADYVRSRLPGQPTRFGKILLSVAALRSLAEKPIEHLFFSSVPGKDMFETILSQVISSN